MRPVAAWLKPRLMMYGLRPLVIPGPTPTPTNTPLPTNTPPAANSHQHPRPNKIPPPPPPTATKHTPANEIPPPPTHQRQTNTPLPTKHTNRQPNTPRTNQTPPKPGGDDIVLQSAQTSGRHSRQRPLFDDERHPGLRYRHRHLEACTSMAPDVGLEWQRSAAMSTPSTLMGRWTAFLLSFVGANHHPRCRQRR